MEYTGKAFGKCFGRKSLIAESFPGECHNVSIQLMDDILTDQGRILTKVSLELYPPEAHIFIYITFSQVVALSDVIEVSEQIHSPRGQFLKVH